MIRVERSPEPSTFDRDVRQRGLSVERAGGSSYAWRRAIPDLRAAYDDTCAYLGMRIDGATGLLTVDHFLPRTERPDLAFEWSNLRLSSHRMNTNKGRKTNVIDPFTVRSGEFALSFADGSVRVGTTRRPALVSATIRSLKLNECSDFRLQRIDLLMTGRVSWDFLKWDFPYGATELVRQGYFP